MTMAQGEQERRVSQKYFKTWKYSLFVDFSDQEVRRLHTMNWHKDMRYTDANFAAAVILLKKENITGIEQFIAHALEKNPESIHAWCNRGLFSLKQRPPHRNQAQKAAEMIERLLKKEVPRRDAQLEQAYWLSSHKRSEECRKEALRVFQAELNEEQHPNFSHHYYYIKMLNSEGKKWNSPEDRRRIIQLMVDQLAILARSNDTAHEFEVWHFLTEVEYHRKAKVQLDLGSLLNAVGVESIDLLVCSEKMIEFVNSADPIHIYSNSYAKIGRVLLQHSFSLSNKEERVKILDKALGQGKKSLEIKASPVERGPNLCAEIYMWKWAIQYYEEHKADVESYVQRMDSPYNVMFEEHKADVESYEQKGNAKFWTYLVRCYYPASPDNSPNTRRYLEEARTIIQEAMVPGCRTAPTFYPRILMLLGEDQNTVELSFDDIWFEDSFKRLYKSDEGMFYETIGKREEAIKCYRIVIDENKPNHKVSYNTALNGLHRLKAAPM